MYERNLGKALPTTKRDIAKRLAEKNPEVVQIAKQFGELFFDGPRTYGYGGYHYDGRWKPVAQDIIQHFKLKPGNRVLDVGCAKGFLLKDLQEACPGLEVRGLDISEYAIAKSDESIRPFLTQGSADALPYPDNFFTAAISINTLHNFSREQAIIAVKEIQR